MATDEEPQELPKGWKPYYYPMPDGGVDKRGYTWPIPPTSPKYKPPTGPEDFDCVCMRDDRKAGGNITAHDTWGYRMVVEDRDWDTPMYARVRKITSVSPYFPLTLVNLPRDFPKYVIVAPEPGSYPPKWSPKEFQTG